jgi:hypothetical protein
VKLFQRTTGHGYGIMRYEVMTSSIVCEDGKMGRLRYCLLVGVVTLYCAALTV